MATSVTHAFVSAVPDGGDASVVRPSNWNAEHVVEVDALDLTTAETDTSLALMPDGAGGVQWGPVAAGLLVANDLVSSPTNADQTIPINSATYITMPSLEFLADDFGFTDFRIVMYAANSEAATVTTTYQLAIFDAPGTPLSAAGNDLVVNSDVMARYDSGWIAFDTPLVAATLLVLAAKGSNGTVDLLHRYVRVYLRKV